MSFKGKCQCCCRSHCEVAFHNYYLTKTFYQALPSIEEQLISVVNTDSMEVVSTEEDEESCDMDNFTALIMSVGLNLA